MIQRTGVRPDKIEQQPNAIEKLEIVDIVFFISYSEIMLLLVHYLNFNVAFVFTCL